MNEKQCDNCNSDDLVINGGYFICRQCGCENDMNIDQSQEWRYYGENDNKSSDPSRCGMPINELLPELSMSIIGQNISHREKSLIKVYGIIDSISDEYNYSTAITNNTKRLYQLYSENNINRGKILTGIIAACLKESAKKYDKIISNKELVKICKTNLKKINNGCKQFIEFMEYENMNIEKILFPEDYINKYCIILKINSELKQKILKVCYWNNKLNILFNNTYESIALSCIYFAICNEKINIKIENISELCDISKETLNKTYKLLLPYKKILFL